MGASDDWQLIVIPASKLINRFDKRAMQDWSRLGEIRFTPKRGADITKVLFAEFRWVGRGKTRGKE